MLDVGCGVGTFLRLVAERGAQPFGLDASAELLARARERLLDADLRVGDMEALPYEDDTFDLVTGFSAFFFANDFVAALREAGRVAKPRAHVVIQVWGAHERNELEAMKTIARPFFPPRPADAPAEPDYSQPGVLVTSPRAPGWSPTTPSTSASRTSFLTTTLCGGRSSRRPGLRFLRATVSGSWGMRSSPALPRTVHRMGATGFGASSTV